MSCTLSYLRPFHRQNSLLRKIALTLFIALGLVGFNSPVFAHPGLVVIQTDFGLKDGAVSSMRGVMESVDRSLTISDLTNEITPFNIWEAAYRLRQTASYWPKGTVFVSVVDPGVGTHRKSIVALSNDGHYFVTPDNGTLTLIADTVGLKEVREIDETKNRLKGSADSYTFHGRDVYGYTAARLASGKITFQEVGPLYTQPIVKLSYQKAFIKGNQLQGTIAILDPEYGNLWTNIDVALAKQFGLTHGQKYKVRISDGEREVYHGTLSYQNTFGEVPKGESLIYTNSLTNLAIGTNQENFSHKYNVTAGPRWHIEIDK
jgi:S-adenosylmethionine hydrolase